MWKDWVLFFEYTMTGTPQQNAYVERAFPMIMGHLQLKNKQLWCEAANTAMMLDNILVCEQDRAPLHKMLYDQDAKYAKHLQTFSEMCVTTHTSK